MIKAVLFDVDGVLVDSFEANLAFFQELFRKAGYDAFKGEDYAKLFHVSMLDVIKFWTKSDSEEEINRIMNLGKEARGTLRYKNLISIPEHAEEILNDLSEKYILGIVSSRQRSSILKLPLIEDNQKIFSVIVGYENTENHKPHPEPLLLACKKLRFSPEECVYIGDAQTDINAAHAAGMWSIHFSKTPLEMADASTYSFKEIPEIIKRFPLSVEAV